ncbi:MAG TPA: peptide chain release factor N(5)-glutamine methyltransferase [Rhodoblastus sp.]|nr:peptide chain release factor N(5)-glutamine methyltransferase [Rhodoblastus sp.]
MPGPEAIVAQSGLSREKTLAAGRVFLRKAGVEAAEEDARLLLIGACRINRLALVTGADVAVSLDEAHRYRSFLDRRAGGEPASRILGRRAFWTLDLEVRPGVLDPRGDTEAVVRLALRVADRNGAPRRVLDLGCGSGAILCALLMEFGTASGLGVDLSAEACAATASNIVLCGLGDRASVAQGRWCDGVSGAFDLIVSNPPYIPGGEIAALDREVRDHDPRTALDGGRDGLDAYREIFADAPRLLAPGGAIVAEFGLGQAEDVEKLAIASGLRKIDGERDLGVRDRASAFVVA